MKPSDKPTGAVARVMRAIFHSRVELQWRGGPRLRLVAPGHAREAAAQVEEVAQRERSELAAMLAQLGEALGQAPGTRDSLRHLVYVEQALQRMGLDALHAVPLDVLQRALVQFESQVTNWSQVGLATLRSKMAVAITEREDEDGQE